MQVTFARCRVTGGVGVKLGIRSALDSLSFLDESRADLTPNSLILNWLRGHGSLSGKAPIDRIAECGGEAAFKEDVEAMYDPSKERIKDATYSVDQQLSKLKRCV